jgi:hypothetical protein
MKIQKITSSKGITIYHAYGALAGEFTAIVTGDGNNTTYEIICTGDQFDFDQPLKFIVTGEWEMSDLARFLEAISPKIY